MIISSLHNGIRYIYKQGKLPWYKRLIGMKYGPGWYLEVHHTPGQNPLRSYDQDQSPNPSLVMKVLMETLENGET